MNGEYKEKIIVFGRGAYYKCKEQWILDNCEVKAYLDNNIKDQDINKNVPVLKPSDVRCLHELPIYIMSSPKYVFDMVKQLFSLNVSADRIVLGTNLPPATNQLEDWILHGKVDMSVKPNGICLKYSDYEEIVNDVYAFRKIINDINKEFNPFIETFMRMPTEPANRYWGNPFGSPIDRRYIENFMGDNRKYITGDIVEIGDKRYTTQFGYDVKNSYAMHVYGGRDKLKGNLATGEGLAENFCDCLICTQTLQFIFDLQSTVKNIYKILKPNGTALITVPGISQLDMAGYKSYGESWRFTKQSLEQIFMDDFGLENIKVDSFGNVKTAVCFLYGMCQEHLNDRDFIVNDEMFPVILTLVCKKRD